MGEMRFFAGGNTAEGFFSCFGHILPEAEQKRVFYIKGGPGVGKSSMMKRVAATLQEAGQEVEYYHCSSDPESLDGICAPSLGVMMVDGTAPHVQDPVLPGARDSLLSLGDFLDEKALRPKLPEIRRLDKEIGGRFSRCYQYLAAAAKVRQAGSRGQERPEGISLLCDELTETHLPLRGGRGGLRTLFAAAFTHKGQLGLLSTLPGETTVALECPFGQQADGLLRALGERARARGLNVVALLDPLEPRLWAHLAIPAHGLLFSTQEGLTAGHAVEAARWMDLKEVPEKEHSFDRNAYELLVQRATEQLKAAKTLHDELESHYVAQMDFLRWEEMLARVKAELLGL